MAAAAEEGMPMSSAARMVMMVETAAREQVSGDDDNEAGSADMEARAAPDAIEEITNVLNTLRLSTQVGTIIPNVTGYSFSTNQKETVRARIMRSVPGTILYKCVRVFF